MSCIMLFYKCDPSTTLYHSRTKLHEIVLTFMDKSYKSFKKNVTPIRLKSTQNSNPRNTISISQFMVTNILGNDILFFLLMCKSYMLTKKKKF